jgi:hypothetical protein
MCVAEAESNGTFSAHAPELVGHLGTLLHRLSERGDGRVFIGFDFPIGVPAAFAKRLGLSRFEEMLTVLGEGEFKEFFNIAERPEEISPKRPFYPRRPGGTSRQHLVDGLGVADFTQLLRQCELSTDRRGSASSVFWTLGGQQVGRGAIIGWRDVLQPAIRDPALDIALWPFDGDLPLLLNEHQIVVAETYPAEACLHIGIGVPGRGWSKRSQDDRRSKAESILCFAEEAGVYVTPGMHGQLREGFGPSVDGEDRFDATVGLLSMLAVALSRRPAGTPLPGEIREIEGWILGQSNPDGLSV